MTLTGNLSYWLRGTGRRRAADTIPLIEAERDHWHSRCVALEQRNADADALIITLWCTNDGLERQLAQAAADREQAIADRDVTAEGHQFLLQEHDELAGRFTELLMENANLKAISSPAPADGGPAIPPRDPHDTIPIPVFTLWDAHGVPAFGSAA
jgi:hypothetical protein